MALGPGAPGGERPTVAVLWHQDVRGKVAIVAVFEKASDAKDMLRNATADEPLIAGRYRVTVRPLHAGLPVDRMAAWH